MGGFSTVEVGQAGGLPSWLSGSLHSGARRAYKMVAYKIVAYIFLHGT